MRTSVARASLATLLSLAFAACAPGALTATPQATATGEIPTPTPSPTASPIATLVATATPPPAPIATATATATPPATPAPTPPPPPPTPTATPLPVIAGLQIACATTTSSLSWSEPDGTRWVDVERRQEGQQFVQQLILPYGMGAFEDEGLVPATAYEYRLTARFDDEDLVAEASCTTGEGRTAFTLPDTAFAAQYGVDGVNITIEEWSSCDRVEWGPVVAVRSDVFLATAELLQAGPDTPCESPTTGSITHLFEISTFVDGTLTLEVEGETVVRFSLTAIESDRINAPIFGQTTPAGTETRVGFYHDGIDLDHFEMSQRRGISGSYSPVPPEIEGGQRYFHTGSLLFGVTYCWNLTAISLRGTRSEPAELCAPITGTRSNGWIILSSVRDGNDEIYYDWGRRLTERSAEDIQPTQSPNGEQIAFVSRSSDNWQIWVMDSLGEELTRLTNDDATSNWTPRWSPDSSKIAFSSFREDRWDIYVMNADGSDETRLTSDVGDDVSPEWSPDGSRIAFNSRRDGNRDIYVVNADGSGEVRLTSSIRDDADPDWSNDGSQITFSSRRDGNAEIYKMNADGTDPVRLTIGGTDAENPVWSPLASLIVFTRSSQIFSVDPNTGVESALTSSDGHNSSPVWSPDGTKIAFFSTRDGDREVYTMNADGTSVKQETVNDVPDSWLDW